MNGFTLKYLAKNINWKIIGTTLENENPPLGKPL